LITGACICWPDPPTSASRQEGQLDIDPGAEKRIGILAGNCRLERCYRGIDVPKSSVRASAIEMRRGLGGVGSKREIVIQQPERGLWMARHLKLEGRVGGLGLGRNPTHALEPSALGYAGHQRKPLQF